jgi:CRP/FNR family transcriptional regulator, nitrogen fixation regulation protein
MLAKSQVTDPRSNTMSFTSSGLMALPSTGLPRGHVLEALEPRGFTIRAERDEEIVAQDEKATHCYLIVTGCVRTVQLMEDGRRQVGEFLFAGDLFGWEAMETHDFSAEAVTPVTLRRHARRDVEALADQNREVARRLRDISARRARAGREHMVLLGRKTASERIATFLLNMAERIALDGRSRIELPMSRSDMGDYLGLTIETVCRRLTQLRNDGTIVVKGASIAIRDREALGAADRGRVIH